MNRKVIAATLMFISTSANADWAYVTRSNLGIDYYAEPSTIRREGSIVKMWWMESFSSPQVMDGTPYLSTRALEYFNCSNQTSIKTYITVHPNRMGSGAAIAYGDIPNPQWTPVPPNTTLARLLQYACSK